MIKIEEINSYKFLVDYGNGTSFKIPSQQFPLNSNPVLLTSSNTFEIDDETIEHVFNTMKPWIARCYYNSEELIDALLIAGINQQRIKSYVGWVFNGDTLPNHHSILLIDDKHVLDLGIRKCSSYFFEKSNLTPSEKKEKFLQEIEDSRDKPNSNNFIFGKIPYFVAYVVSECTPSQAIKIRCKLKSAFPKHISFSPVDQHGRTTLQNEMLKRLHNK